MAATRTKAAVRALSAVAGSGDLVELNGWTTDRPDPAQVATRAGLSLVPLSQVIEVDETRWALQREVFSDSSEPQIPVRIGWQEIGRSAMPKTPRRHVADVIQP